MLALALAAAGLPSTVVLEDGGGVGDGTGSGVGQGTGDGAGATDGGFERPAWLAPLIATAFALLRVLGAIAILLLVALFVYLAVTQYEKLLDALRDLLSRLPRAVGQVIALAAFVLALLVLWPEGSLPQAAPVVPIPGAGGGSASEATPTAPDPLTILAVGLGIATISLLVVWGVQSRSRSRDDEEDSAADDAVSPTPDGDVSEQPVRSETERADSGDGPVDSVVAAWREMVTLLDGGNYRTATPGQIAARAVAAGLDRDDVEVLTRLFEDVRYGDVELTDEQETRALLAFRRIETKHAERDEP